MTTLFTFGDSVLDCAIYNEHRVTPGALLARNDDRLYPAFRGRDLQTYLGGRVALKHRARDGAIVYDLAGQINGQRVADDSIVLVSIGGNDLLTGLLTTGPRYLREFSSTLEAALRRISNARLFVANIYDPSFGDDGLNFLGIDPAQARRQHAAVNDLLGEATSRVGGHLVELHAHFLRGTPAWFSNVIEPSAVGCSEVRRAFLMAWMAASDFGDVPTPAAVSVG